jgi:hypothetical protein
MFGRTVRARRTAGRPGIAAPRYRDGSQRQAGGQEKRRPFRTASWSRALELRYLFLNGGSVSSTQNVGQYWPQSGVW